MSTGPRLTVGLPVYNGQKYLKRAIESILAQTYQDFVLIISDNGSKDETQKICEEYSAADPRIQYHRYEQNRGAAWNFNNCVHLATTPFFKWQCYDDELEPQMLERCMAVIEKEPDVVLAYPRTRIIDDDGNTIGPWSDNLETTSPYPHKRLRHYWGNKSRNEAQYGIWRKDVLLKSGMMGTIPYSDQVLMMEMILRGKFREIQEYDFLKRFHSGISTEAYSVYQLSSFLDTRKRSQRFLPRLERFIEFFKAVHRVHLPLKDSLRCYLELTLLLLYPQNWGRMLTDLVVFVRSFVKQTKSNP
jgi:glycosyltransferase involved in cell wall biosynthesis